MLGRPFWRQVEIFERRLYIRWYYSIDLSGTGLDKKMSFFPGRYMLKYLEVNCLDVSN